MLVTLDARCRGSEHIKQNKPLQDFSGSTTDRWKSYAFAIVADGHGGEKYFRSAVGAEFAVRSAALVSTRIVKELQFHIKKKETEVIEKTLQNLCSRILIEWREKVETHYAENPLTEEETALCESLQITRPLAEDAVLTLYGSTLLFAVYLEGYDFWFTLQIGDGRCIAIKEDNSVFYPIPDDEKLGFGVTSSLCNKNAIEYFHYSFGFEKLNGIAVMTDGLTDSFANEKLPDFILSVQKNAIQDRETTKTELNAFLPKLSEQGSGDDISIAGIFVKEDKNKLKSILPSLLKK